MRWVSESERSQSLRPRLKGRHASGCGWDERLSHEQLYVSVVLACIGTELNLPEEIPSLANLAEPSLYAAVSAKKTKYSAIRAMAAAQGYSPKVG